jgi:hypothetical protein
VERKWPKQANGGDFQVQVGQQPSFILQIVRAHLSQPPMQGNPLKIKHQKNWPKEIAGIVSKLHQ